MKNVTLAFDEQTLTMGRNRARNLGTSFNAYVRQLVAHDAVGDGSQMDDMFKFMDKHPLPTPEATWTREGLYERS